jgi:FMN phosphatase YigB (HAD superfamily)
MIALDIMIRAIIFDFGSVIYKTNWKELNRFFFERNGFNILVSEMDDEELVRIYKESDLGKEDFEKFFIRIKGDVDVKKAVDDYKEGYSKFKILNYGLLDLISRLRKKDIMLFGFTDIKKEHYEANLESGLYEGFIEIFASYKFGNIKSEKEAFEKLGVELKKYGLSPPECIFIDDHLPNIENAKKFGFNVIHYGDFPSVKKIRGELEKYGFELGQGE